MCYVWLQMKEQFEANIKLYQDKFNKLKNKHVLIIGIGGVGSWCAELLSRSGITYLTLVDMDDICFTNINRQVHALHSSAGKMKVDALKERLLDINPSIKIKTIIDFFNEKSKDKIFEFDYDFVIDAMDSAKNKALLVNECSLRKIPMILSGAAGGKKDINKIRLNNFKRVENDKLIKTVRRDLKKHYPDFRKRNYFLPCVFSPEETFIPSEYKGGGINCRGALGSSGIVTSAFALHIAQYVMEYFIDE